MQNRAGDGHEGAMCPAAQAGQPPHGLAERGSWAQRPAWRQDLGIQSHGHQPTQVGATTQTTEAFVTSHGVKGTIHPRGCATWARATHGTQDRSWCLSPGRAGWGQQEIPIGHRTYLPNAWSQHWSELL